MTPNLAKLLKKLNDAEAAYNQAKAEIAAELGIGPAPKPVKRAAKFKRSAEGEARRLAGLARYNRERKRKK